MLVTIVVRIDVDRGRVCPTAHIARLLQKHLRRVHRVVELCRAIRRGRLWHSSIDAVLLAILAGHICSRFFEERFRLALLQLLDIALRLHRLISAMWRLVVSCREL